MTARTVVYETRNTEHVQQMGVKISLKHVIPQKLCAQHLTHDGEGRDKYSMLLDEREFALLLTRDGDEQRAHMLQENSLSYLLQSADGENAWTFAERVIGLPKGALTLAFEGHVVDIKKHEEYEMLLRELLRIIEQLTKLPPEEFKQCLEDLKGLKHEHEIDREHEAMISQAIYRLATQWRMPEAEDGHAS